MAVPFWDIDLSIKEMERVAKMGHTGVGMCGEPAGAGFAGIDEVSKAKILHRIAVCIYHLD